MEATKHKQAERRSEDTTALFYSQCLLSKKGTLAAIWVAACCLKRLRKRQVTDTHIPSSVDTILLEGLSCVTYRVLAYLLLGVVRIYSRKVEYLFQDCHEAVCNINKFSVGKKVVPFKNIIRPSYSIILPKRYELDSFQLEVADVPDEDDVAQNEEPQDARRGIFAQFSLDKEKLVLDKEENHGDQISTLATQQLETSSAQTPHKLSADCEASTATCTPPDKVFSPHRTGVEMELRSLDKMKVFQTSKDKLRELKFPQEDCMDIDMICEADIELLNLMNDYELQNIDEQDGVAKDEATVETVDRVLPEEEPCVLEKTAEKVDQVLPVEEPCVLEKAVEKVDQVLREEEPCVLEKTVEKVDQVLPEEEPCVVEKTEEKLDNVLPEDKEVPCVAEKASDSEVQGGKVSTNVDDATQESFVLPTPAKKENIQRPCKRKCIIDAPTVLDNQVVRQAISDASDLVCKRRKVPHTVLDIWRFHTISKNFLEPVIPCVLLEPEQHAANCIRKAKETAPGPALRVVVTEPIEISEVPADMPQDAVVAPRTPTHSRSTIAPGTPILCPTSARVFASSMGGDSDGEGPVHLYGNTRKESSVHDDEEEDSGPNLMDEEDTNEGDSQEHTNQGVLSTRTRTVVRYLHQVIQDRKKQGEESAFPLLPILKCKTRAQSARFFFEILVLSTRGLVTVRQEKAYDNVLVEETPKMEATLAGW